MRLNLRGQLLSTSFLAAKLAGVTTERSVPSPKAGAIGPVSSLRAMLEAGAAPLLSAAGLGRADEIERTGDVLVATLAVADRSVLLLVAPWGEPLHRHWRAAIEHATRRAARWCVLFNGPTLRLLDASRPHSTRFAEFDLDALYDESDTASAFHLIVGRLPALDSLVRESDEHGTAVCRSLKDGVLAASSEMLAALARPGAGQLPLDAAFDQALTIVYRVLFLLFAESRGLVPLWHPVYRDSYAIDTLVTAALAGRQARGLWDALRAIARLAHSGCRAGDLRVTPFNGRLFSPVWTPLAERQGLDDERAKRALVALATRVSTAGRERIAYRDLGVEQLGSVYESLLDYRPSARPIALVPGCGVRKTTGTFYTPQPIATYLVRAALGPLVRDATADEILALRVVDPAMGSGAILVAACHYMADAYEAALVREGRCHPGDISVSERTTSRRMIAERCLYGVDINPMAVQLARLSLWLTTLAADRPLTFLDHRLQSGDSLLGAWVDSLRTPPRAGRARARHDEATRSLFDDGVIEQALRGALPIRFSLELTPDDTLDQVRAKERALSALERGDSDLSRWKRIAGIWCAAWLADDRTAIPAAAFNALADQVLTGRGALPPHLARRYLQHADEISTRRRLFHWELEFPEVFFDRGGQRLQRPGFDAVLGNPPWEVLRDDGAARHFHRESGVYSSATTGHGNLYQLFAERAIALLRAGGRFGLVLPSGLATDHGAAALRRQLLRDCDVDALVGLDNERGVFPIHRSVRFLLATATKGSPTTQIACRLGESDVAALDAATDEPPRTSSWFRVRLTPAFIARVSGGAMTVPALRTETDAAIVERAATLFPPLGSDAGWAARFGRELNATDDRACFGTHGLPVVDGKHVEPFRVHLEACERFVTPARARQRLRVASFEHARLAYRDVASATNRLTLIAAILPAGCVSTHTLFCLRTGLPRSSQHFLCGLFNSLVINYLVRLRVTTHVTTATVEALPVPPPDCSPSARREIAALARLLSRRFDRDAWTRLQVRAAGLYQLTSAELTHVLGTFPLIAQDDRDAVRRGYLAAEARRFAS